MFDVIVRSPRLNKYLQQEHIQRLEGYIREANGVLERGDVVSAQALRNRMLEYRAQLPPPTEDMFFASLISENRDVVDPVERSQVQQEMTQMENSISRGDIDTANEHLTRLRGKITAMLDKYPSDLLTKK
jgi:hypothetical protein